MNCDIRRRLEAIERIADADLGAGEEALARNQSINQSINYVLIDKFTAPMVTQGGELSLEPPSATFVEGEKDSRIHHFFDAVQLPNKVGA